jgi:hypothetical protein
MERHRGWLGFLTVVGLGFLTVVGLGLVLINYRKT